MNKYIGHLNQILGVEEHRLVGGKKDGMRILEVRNGLGLELVISLDRNADIARLTYKGRNMSYMSPCGYVHPAYYDATGTNFLKSFTAGFLTTCGFINVGSPNNDNGEELPLHGNIANVPTESHSFEILENEIVIKTKTLDQVIFSHKYVLNREFHISTKQNKFYFIDSITNEGDLDAPLSVLYHMNMGYPLLSENALVFVNSNKVISRNARAEEGIKEWDKMMAPQVAFDEQCYFHEFKDEAVAAIYNPDIHLGLKISFDSNNLKHLTEWKMMGTRDYVLGLEPGNCTPVGRDILRKNKELIMIKPNETIKYRVNVNMLDTLKAFENLKK